MKCDVPKIASLGVDFADETLATPAASIDNSLFVLPPLLNFGISGDHFRFCLPWRLTSGFGDLHFRSPKVEFGSFWRCWQMHFRFSVTHFRFWIIYFRFFHSNFGVSGDVCKFISGYRQFTSGLLLK